MNLTTHDVNWRPTAVPAPGLRGRPALRAYLDGLRAVGRLLDAHPYSFEAIGDRVTVSGVPRLRHADGSVEAIQRWWVYRVAHGKIAAAGSHCTHAEALRDTRTRQTKGPRSERPLETQGPNASLAIV